MCMFADVISCCCLQYQPVLGSTLKGKDNFKQLIHGFAEVCLPAVALVLLLRCHPIPHRIQPDVGLLRFCE